MRRELRRNRSYTGSTRASLIFAIIALSFLPLFFQNCSGGFEAAGNNPLYTAADSTSCTGVSCTTDAQQLTMTVGNVDPIVIRKNVDSAIDIGGFCDTGGYSETVLYYELRDGPNTPVPMSKTSVSCDPMGRFRFRLQLPGGYDYTHNYTLALSLRAVESDGTEVENPSGLSRRELTITSP